MKHLFLLMILFSSCGYSAVESENLKQRQFNRVVKAYADEFLTDQRIERMQCFEKDCAMDLGFKYCYLSDVEYIQNGKTYYFGLEFYKQLMECVR